MQKKIIFFFLISAQVCSAQVADSVLCNGKVKRLQAKIQRQIEKLAGEYREVLDARSVSQERFLFFKPDSSGRKIGQWALVDETGKRDTLLKQKYISEIVMYWRDFFSMNSNYRGYTIIQPVLIRKEEDKDYQIGSIPNFTLEKQENCMSFIIRLPQMNIWMGKTRK